MWGRITGFFAIICEKIWPQQEKIHSEYNTIPANIAIIVSKCEKILIECKIVTSKCNTVLSGGQKKIPILSGLGKAFCREFFASLFLASATFIITERGFFEFPEYLTLSMISVNEVESEENQGIIPKPTKVILLTDLSYESDFNQTSPLDRKKLADMFEKILERKPSVLAVDLDLSPQRYKTDDQTGLDELLRGYQKRGNTKIVLITPVPVVSSALLLEKVKWMKEMCEARITFAYPDVFSHLGVVMKYFQFTPTLGNEAFRLSKYNNTDFEESGKARNKSMESAVCSRLLTMNDDNFLRKNGENRYKNLTRKEKINFKVINSKSYSNMQAIPIFDLSRADWDRNIANGEVVFIGGSWGLRDKYITPAKRDIPGVFIHAATFYSNGKPIINIMPLYGYIADLCIGMLLGVIFYYVYSWYCNKLTIYRMFINFFLPIVIMAGMLLIAQISLQSNLWIHPGPMLAGVYVDSQIVGGNSQKVKYSKRAILIGIAVVLWAWVELAIKIL